MADPARPRPDGLPARLREQRRARRERSDADQIALWPRRRPVTSLISLISLGTDAETVDERHGLTTIRVRIGVCV
jgi:hypothetical protein